LSSRFRYAAVTLIVVAVALGVWYGYPNDARAIRRQLDRLSADISAGAEETDFARLARAARIGRYFSEDVRIQVTGLSAITGRGALVALAAQARQADPGFRLDFVDVQVSVDPDHQHATVSLTARVTTTSPAAGQSDTDARELRFIFRKVEREWLVAQVTDVAAIERVS
jgi:hypothetical protein